MDSGACHEANKRGGTRQVAQIGSRKCRKAQPKGEACGDRAMAANTIDMSDVDFSANFDGQKWTVAWKWTHSEPSLRNRVACYKVPADHQEAFDKEVEAWIEEGILQPVPQDEPVTSVLPLMAVVQPNKRKVRPVLDFRQLNAHVSSHSRGAWQQTSRISTATATSLSSIVGPPSSRYCGISARRMLHVWFENWSSYSGSTGRVGTFGG